MTASSAHFSRTYSHRARESSRVPGSLQQVDLVHPSSSLDEDRGWGDCSLEYWELQDDLIQVRKFWNGIRVGVFGTFRLKIRGGGWFARRSGVGGGSIEHWRVAGQSD